MGKKLSEEVRVDDDGGEFTSPIFGPTRRPTEAERAALRLAAETTPVALFQELSKWMNSRGLMLGVHHKESQH